MGSVQRTSFLSTPSTQGEVTFKKKLCINACSD